MADSKITALTALTAADPVNDMFPVVDVSDTSMAASGTTKRISANNILSSSPTASGALTVTGLVTAGSANVSGLLGVGTVSPDASFKATLSGLYGLRVQSADTNNSAINFGSDTSAGYSFIDTTKTGSGSFLPLRFSTSDTERIRISTAGDVTISTGNVVMGTSGKGIDFSATASGSGTMTSELLNDYEEGTWTPVLGGFGGTSGQTYSLQTGRYTKVGRQVICSFEATLTAVGTVTGNAIISGLPFSSVSTSLQLDGGTTTIGFANNLATNQIFLSGYLNGAGAYSFITAIAAAGTLIGNITATNLFGNTTRLSGTITYTAS